MTPGLRLDTGEFIPASELNQRIDMSEKNNPELMPWDRAGGHYMHTEYEMRQAIEPLQKRIAEQRTELIALTGDNERLQRRIAELEAQLEKGKQLCREQTATIVDRTKTVLDLEAQIASRQPLVTVEQIADLVRDHLTSVYVCTRVWNAWRVGTMTEDDFIPASEIEMADEIAEAVFALLPAPAQQPLASGQEPVAWQTFDGEGGYEFRQFAENETYHDDYIKRNGEKYSTWVTPLYTHPAPAQQPLTLREMAAAIGTFADDAINIARAIEYAHGIKEKK
jgi:hypothetical protein